MESVFKEMSSFFSRENEVVILHNLQGVCEFADQRMFKFGTLATEIQSGSVYDQVEKADLKYVSHAHNVIYETSQTSTVFRIRRNVNLGYCHSMTYVIKDRWTSRPKAFLSFFSVLSEKEGRQRWKRQDKEYRGMMAAKQTLSLPGRNTNLKDESLSPMSSSCSSSSGSVDLAAVLGHKMTTSPAGSSTEKEVSDHDGTTFGLQTLGNLTLSSDVHVGNKSHFGDKTGYGETAVWPVGCPSDTPSSQQAQFDNLQDISSSGSPLSFAKTVSSGENSPQAWSSPMSMCLTPSDTLQLSPTYTSPDVQTQNATSQASDLLRELMATQTSVSPVTPTVATDSTCMHQNGHNGSAFISGTPEISAAVDSGEMLGSLSTGDQEGKVRSQHPSVAVVHPTQARAMVSSNGQADLQPLTDPLAVFTSPSENTQPVLEASLTFLTPPSHSLVTEEYRFNRRLAKQQRQLSQQIQQYKREMQLVQNQIDLNQCIMKLQKLKGKEQDMALLTELDRSPQVNNMYCSHGLTDQMDTAEASLDLPSTSTTTTTQLPALQEVTNKNNDIWYKQGISNSDSM
ncbi:hypothetical protein Bbelb_114160 [Branchiostoma belcheri]|nr:hypothetical protein Bbelb_114160 [Branchiostoma belcheri]